MGFRLRILQFTECGTAVDLKALGEFSEVAEEVSWAWETSAGPREQSVSF